MATTEEISSTTDCAPDAFSTESPVMASDENCFARSSPDLLKSGEFEAKISKRKGISSSEPLALSLFVIGGDGDEETDGQPRPLQVVDPKISREIFVRRSPMLTGIDCGGVDRRIFDLVKVNLSRTLSLSGLRNSPRVSSALVATESDVNLGKSGRDELERKSIEWSNSSEKRLMANISSEKCDGSKKIFSRSPRLETDGQPRPLQIVDLKMSRENSVRRSPRVTTNEVNSSCTLSLSGGISMRKCSRKSPRLSSAVVATESDVNVRKSLDSGKNCRSPAASGRLLRSQSPSSKKAKVSSEKSDGKVFRRSPRLSSSPEKRNRKFEFLELPAPSAKKGSSGKKKSTNLDGNDMNNESGRKSSRSGVVPFLGAGTEDEGYRSLISVRSREVKALAKTMITSGSFEIGIVGQKSLRSRIIPTDGKQAAAMEASASSEKKQIKRSSFFVGDPVPEEEARQRWHWRYELKSQRCKGQSWKLNEDEEDEVILNVDCHYTQAKVAGCIFNLGDCAYIKGDGREKHVGRILEFFRTMEGEDYFRVQWFYKAQDTVMKEAGVCHEKRRLFYSSFMNDNILDCIISKVTVMQIPPKLSSKSASVQSSDFYYDMEYSVEYSTFRNLMTETSVMAPDSCAPNHIEAPLRRIPMSPLDDFPCCGPSKDELTLLDLYAGCGGMSTGLCLGAKLSNVQLVTKWAVDLDSSACDSLRLNHPETLVRNEGAEDFLKLLKEWEKLCKQFVFTDLDSTIKSELRNVREAKSDISPPSKTEKKDTEFEVSCLVDICYGDPCRTGKSGLKFKVRWKGYGPCEDTWEPVEGLSDCRERIGEFVRRGLQSKILPRPGDVDVICGGPPCQGISGYNRFRNVDAPLEDERNRQIIIFMDIVKFLQPKYVLMENVVDILRFDKGSLARYALSRLVQMKYQARLGIIAAGCYGVPQFRLRVFLWGASHSEKLPQFPLPSHDVVVRYWPPFEFEQNTVAYDEGQPRELEKAVILRDALSDLPAVTTHETREKMTYEMPPETEFQRYIRLPKHELMGFNSSGATEEATETILYDHRPYKLSEDDYTRVCLIPRVKGANFRDLPGVMVGADNVARRDPSKEQIVLPSGKPMIPDYALTFEQGKSKRPFARLWWDETVATVVTFPNLHSQAAVHPEQDRVLTIREYARLQGFPDYYRFCGTVKERYCQIGNAVAVPVSRALGYTLGMAHRKLSGNGPLTTLPPNFSYQQSLDAKIIDSTDDTIHQPLTTSD